MVEKIGFIGLGKMGSAMVENLASKMPIHGKTEYDSKIKLEGIVGYDVDQEAGKRISNNNFTRAESLQDLVDLTNPGKRVIWMMVPAGDPVKDLIEQLSGKLRTGDIIIDGGNSDYRMSMYYGRELEKKGVRFLDCGTSGGIEGARTGACMMFGGDEKTFIQIEPIAKAMCVTGGCNYLGSSGAGHYFKMIHNAIEYGMMAAIAEAMKLIQGKENEFAASTKAVVQAFSRGSIISGKLLECLAAGLERKNLRDYSGKVPVGHTEAQMAELALENGLFILRLAIGMRDRSRRDPSNQGRVINLLREEFGGHKPD